MTSILFTAQVTARPENVSDGNNERYAAQAFATEKVSRPTGDRARHSRLRDVLVLVVQIL